MNTPIEILMVEDNPADIELTREALSRGKLHNKLHITEDGEQALDFLHQRGQYKSAPRPDIVLLDLNLPKITGREILAAVKSDEGLASIPVIILSSSEDNQDIKASYALNANSFVTKPVRVEDFLSVVKTIEHFWIEIVKLPSGKN
ncbi:response regulator [Candidatus Endobugula sertula]|uniref:Response regulator n=1 Tax=Candidatus Endobugula sertula TaxID=62101 RepID=A0A1D2QS52_9GAMM|nr:response regulator [Candidatus Endobugula sertula]